MGRRKVLFELLALFMVFAIAGCSTVPKKVKEEISGIKTRVDSLESKVEGVESKQAENERAAAEQAQALEELKARREAAVRTNVMVKSRPAKSREAVKDIQACLKNAGFYDGKIDGIKGRATKRAIKAFQKANGLRADGVVGKRTWELLSKYSSGGTHGAAKPEEVATK
jgi:peptidoglycan hydrolase-like protein with peptidoglycan-binding domain